MRNSSNHTDAPTPELLAQFGLFGALERNALEYLCTTLHCCECEAGEDVFHEGELGNEMFVVLQGEFEVLKRSKHGIDARVALLGGGDWFGEMSLFDPQPRSASVRSLAPSKLLRLSSAELEVLYRADPRAYTMIVLNVARELSRRLRVADGILADLVVSIVGRPGRRAPPVVT